MTLLPKELRGSEEQTSSHFPSNDVAPLIDEQRQIAIGLNPIPIGIPDDRFRRRTDDKRLFEFGSAGVSNDSHFRGKSFDVFGFFLQEAFRYEHREICVHMAGFLEHPIQRLLHLFPDGIAVGADDHATLNWRVIREFCCGNHIGIPPGVVLTALGDLCLGHNQAIIALWV